MPKRTRKWEFIHEFDAPCGHNYDGEPIYLHLGIKPHSQRNKFPNMIVICKKMPSNCAIGPHWEKTRMYFDREYSTLFDRDRKEYISIETGYQSFVRKYLTNFFATQPESSQPKPASASQPAESAQPEALYDDEAFSDFPGDNSHPEQDIPRKHIPDVAPAETVQPAPANFIPGKFYGYSFSCSSRKFYCRIISITDKTVLIHSLGEIHRVKLHHDRDGAYFYPVGKCASSTRPSDIAPEDLARNLEAHYSRPARPDPVQYKASQPELPEPREPETPAVNSADFVDEEQRRLGYFSVGQSFNFSCDIYTVKSRSKSFVIFTDEYGKEYRKKVYNTEIKSFRGIPGNRKVRVPEFITFKYHGDWAKLSSKFHLIEEAAQPESAHVQHVESQPEPADNPGFTIVPSEHIERPQYVQHDDYIPDERPCVNIPALDIPPHNPAAALVPYEHAASIRNFFHIIAIYLRLWLAMHIHTQPDVIQSHVSAPWIVELKDYEPDDPHDVSPLIYKWQRKKFYEKLKLCRSQIASCKTREEIIACLQRVSSESIRLLCVADRVMNKFTRISANSECERKLAYAQIYADKIIQRREKAMTINAEIKESESITQPRSAHNPAAAVVPYADASPLRYILRLIALYIRLWLAVHITVKPVRTEAWQFHSCQYCENDPRPNWTHKQFALGIILGHEYSEYERKERYCIKSRSEWLREKYTLSQLGKIAMSLDIKLADNPSPQKAACIISTAIADTVINMEHYYVCTYIDNNPPALPVELQQYFTSRANNPVTESITITAPAKEIKPKPDPAHDADRKLIDMKDLHENDRRNARNHNIAVLSSCMFPEAVISLLMSTSVQTIKALGLHLGYLYKGIKGNKQQLAERFAAQMFRIRNRKPNPAPAVTPKSQPAPIPEGIKFFTDKKRQICFQFLD